MLLMKHKTGMYKQKQYYQYIISVSPATIKKLGWKKGQKLTPVVFDDKVFNEKKLVISIKQNKERF